MTFLTSVSEAKSAASILACRQVANADWFTRANTSLIEAQLREDAQAEEEARAELRRVEEDSERIHAEYREAHVQAAARELERDPRALIQAADRQRAERLLFLLAAHTDDAWAEAIAKRVAIYRGRPNTHGYSWGLEWKQVAAEVHAFFADRYPHAHTEAA